MGTERGARVIPAEDGVYRDIDDEDYHRDPDSLSSSGARTILWDTPAKFRADQLKRPDPKPDYDMGHGAHLYVLGKGPLVVEVDADTWQSGAARQARRDAWDAGKVPLLAKQVATAKQMAERVRDHPKAAALLSAGDAEISGYWHDELTGVRLRWRADWLHPGRSRIIIVDYKSTKNGHPAAFSKSVAEYRYHQQDAWYRDGLIACDVDTDPLFVFIAQEKTPPYLVSVHEVELPDVERGRALNRKAIELYAKCRENDEWPGYGDQIHAVDFPSYARYREEQQLT